VSAPLFPAFLKLAGRKVIVVGAGPVGASKIDALVTAGADVTVIAPDVVDAVADAPVRIERRRFRPSDLEGAWFAVAAAPPDVNREVGAAAEARHVFVNAVDDLANATAYLGGVVRKSGVTLAISTDGRAPALAGLLREGLETLLPDDVETWLAVSESEREAWRERQIPIAERRPLLLAAINRLYDQRRSNGPVVTDRKRSEESGEAIGAHRTRPEKSQEANA
jgi:uroporphyrin-III C-methyltransferase/precorrin-2 dehydrogenase/sirohydrochlorin ferrochelatase